MIIAPGFERTLVTEFLEASFAVVGCDESGNGGREFGTITMGAAVDDLFLKRCS